MPLLERVLDEHPEDPRAALAAFTLGRVESALDRPARAAEAFARAIAIGPPAALHEDAMARLVEARAAAGERAAATEAARAYLARFPEGRHAEAIRRYAE